MRKQHSLRQPCLDSLLQVAPSDWRQKTGAACSQKLVSQLAGDCGGRPGRGRAQGALPAKI